MAPTKFTKFNNSWLENSQFKHWLEKDENSEKSAKCKLCLCTIELSNMGRRALDSHRKSKKHASKTQGGCGALKSWLQSKPETSQSLCDYSSSVRSCSSDNSNISPKDKQDKHSSIISYVEKEEVTKAEILWTLNMVKRHQSYNSSKNCSALFSSMFPDSAIAKQFSCRPGKCSYLTVYGLAPYFEHSLHEKLREVPVYSVSFDESFNRISKNEQMDIMVRFWDEGQQRIVDHYLGSKFLGHTTASCMMESFREGTRCLSQDKILQVSTDGPSVMLKFHKDLKLEREATCPDLPSLLDLGTCGLHVVHGAFKTAFQETGWKLDNILRGLWHLFNESPARRSDYTSVTGSTIFPRQFCGTRWIDDVSVAERALAMWPNMLKYMESCANGPKHKVPKCASFINVQRAVNDPLTETKLSMFVYVAKLLQPFLQTFQTQKPMVGFLATELASIMRSLLEHFIKKDVVPTHSVSALLKVDIMNVSNYIPVKKVNSGFSTKSYLSKAAVSEAKEVEFKHHCLCCYRMLVKKLKERSPLMSEIVLNLRCIDPRQIASHPVTCKSNLDKLLSLLMDAKRLTSESCDTIAQEFSMYLKDVNADVEHKTKLQNFDLRTDGADAIFASYFLGKHQYAMLWEFLKMILSLFHGQAAVERGFSVNKDVLEANMLESTIVARRLIIDGLASLGEDIKFTEFTVNKSMLNYCKAARAKYKQHLEDQKKKNLEIKTQEQSNERKTQITENKQLSKTYKEAAERLVKEADDVADKALKEKNFSLLAESSSKRKRANEMKEQMDMCQKKIAKLEMDLKLV